ncbi:hypothetical protein [Thermoflexus sp.]|uniref:hypothetical protein n=1 Tax=Thermoflexus sp. TaxID=1969742 RepID=UPI0035E45CDC
MGCSGPRPLRHDPHAVPGAGEHALPGAQRLDCLRPWILIIAAVQKFCLQPSSNQGVTLSPTAPYTPTAGTCGPNTLSTDRLVHQALYEGALYAAVNPYCLNPNSPLPLGADPDVKCNDPNNVQYRAYTRALRETRWIPFSLVDPSRIVVIVEPNLSSPTPTIYEGDRITVIYVPRSCEGMLSANLILRAQSVQIALEGKPKNP